ncbi:hypothetical protein [Seleniivibrio woodruffii]|uniref:hypothetical protein n=1 Tax=Seleniivibrio woodruffii TaxID=1078050 RepID=UPI0024093259|nr:hypothetical protein [Seleniivibrio woodruffii]
MVLKKIASNKYLDVTVGILMFVCALTEFQELFGYRQEVSEGVETHHAIAVFSLVIFFKGLLSLMTGTALIGDTVDKKKGVLAFMRSISEHWVFNLAVALLLMIIGTVEMIEEFSEVKDKMSVWHLGAVLSGLILFFKSQSVLLDSVTFMRKQEHKNEFMRKLVPKISRFFNHPKLETSLAVAVIAVGVIEMFIIEEGGGQGHKSIIVYGLSRIIKIVEPTGAFVDLVEDADRIV